MTSTTSEGMEQAAGQSTLLPPKMGTALTLGVPHLGPKSGAATVSIAQSEVEGRSSPHAVGVEEIQVGLGMQEQQQQQQQQQEGNAIAGGSLGVGQVQASGVQEQQQCQGAQHRGKLVRGVTMPTTSQNNRRAAPPMPMPPMPMQLIQPSTHFQFPLGASLANM